MSEIVARVLEYGGEGMLVLLVAAGTMLSLVIFHRALSPNRALHARLAAVAQRRSTLQSRPAPSRGVVRASRLRAVLDQLKLTHTEEAQKSAELLAQAGWRTREAVMIYLALRLVLPIVLATATLLAVTAMEFSTYEQMVAGASAAAAGAYLPPTVLRRLIGARRKRLQRALPDALDLLVICAEAGLGLEGALNRVGRELRRSQPEIANEMALTALELGFLPNRQDALHNLVRRVDIPSVRSLVNTLGQSERYGTPLAHTIRGLSSEMRDTRMLKAEEKAAKLPATMTVPMIVFILPSVFIILIGPAIIQVTQAFSN
jgi:tight adherence protein C